MTPDMVALLLITEASAGLMAPDKALSPAEAT